ncbi:unnamed protein product [Diatraea saccharalis]|uniref:Uncharacterized protein n=1 Tax=Diatraea saccharalis TaxID=40085 RepID=A0A9N9R5X6_9NEOP|nr:unnamed protein product [Diatraea saccharalis]
MLLEESAKDHGHCDDSTIISDGYTDTGSTDTISPDRFMGVTGERLSDSDSVDTINIWASQPPHPAPPRTPEPQPLSPPSLSSLSSLALPDDLPRTPRLSPSSSSSSSSSTSSHDTDRTVECTSPKGTISPRTTTTTTRNKDKRKGDAPFSMEAWRNTPSCSYARTGDREKETVVRPERPPPLSRLREQQKDTAGESEGTGRGRIINNKEVVGKGKGIGKRSLPTSAIEPIGENEEKKTSGTSPSAALAPPPAQPADTHSAISPPKGTGAIIIYGASVSENIAKTKTETEIQTKFKFTGVLSDSSAAASVAAATSAPTLQTTGTEEEDPSSLPTAPQERPSEFFFPSSPSSSSSSSSYSSPPCKREKMNHDEENSNSNINNTKEKRQNKKEGTELDHYPKTKTNKDTHPLDEAVEKINAIILGLAGTRTGTARTIKTDPLFATGLRRHTPRRPNAKASTNKHTNANNTERIAAIIRNRCEELLNVEKQAIQLRKLIIDLGGKDTLSCPPPPRPPTPPPPLSPPPPNQTRKTDEPCSGTRNGNVFPKPQTGLTTSSPNSSPHHSRSGNGNEHRSSGTEPEQHTSANEPKIRRSDKHPDLVQIMNALREHQKIQREQDQRLSRLQKQIEALRSGDAPGQERITQSKLETKTKTDTQTETKENVGRKRKTTWRNNRRRRTKNHRENTTAPTPAPPPPPPPLSTNIPTNDTTQRARQQRERAPQNQHPRVNESTQRRQLSSQPFPQSPRLQQQPLSVRQRGRPQLPQRQQQQQQPQRLRPPPQGGNPTPTQLERQQLTNLRVLAPPPTIAGETRTPPGERSPASGTCRL